MFKNRIFHALCITLAAIGIPLAMAVPAAADHADDIPPWDVYVGTIGDCGNFSVDAFFFDATDDRLSIDLTLNGVTTSYPFGYFEVEPFTDEVVDVTLEVVFDGSEVLYSSSFTVNGCPDTDPGDDTPLPPGNGVPNEHARGVYAPPEGSQRPW